jgi:hypothetical protein
MRFLFDKNGFSLAGKRLPDAAEGIPLLVF